MGLTEVEKKQIEAEEYRKLIREKLKENQDGRQSGNVSDVQSEASSLKKLAGCLNVFLLLLLPIVGLCFLAYDLFERPLGEFWDKYMKGFWSGNVIEYLVSLVQNSEIWSWMKTPTGLIVSIAVYVLLIVVTGMISPSDLDQKDKEEEKKGCALLVLIVLFPPIIPFLIIFWLLRIIFTNSDEK